MFSVTYAQLNVWLTSFLWPFVRILALIATAPVLSHMAIPMRVKIGVAGFITLIVAPTLGAVPQVTVFSADGVWIIVNQFLIGAALGLTMQVAFAAIDAAGEFIGQQMGLGFAMLYDPRAGGNAVVVSRYLNTIAMLAFLVFDGHLQMISALVTTFQSVPIGADVLGAAVACARVEDACRVWRQCVFDGVAAVVAGGCRAFDRQSGIGDPESGGAADRDFSGRVSGDDARRDVVASAYGAEPHSVLSAGF